MKKKFKGKLVLNKRTVSNLDSDELNTIHGGFDGTVSGVLCCVTLTCVETCFITILVHLCPKDSDPSLCPQNCEN